MCIYFVILLLIVLFPSSKRNLIICSEKPKKNRFNIIYFVFISILLILIAGLRHQQVGYDLSHHYIDNFYKYNEMGWNQLSTFGVENALFIISNLLAEFGLGIRSYIIVLSFLSIFPFLLFLYIESDSIKFTIFLFFCYCIFYQMMNQIQQEIAVSFVLLGYLFLKRNKNILFLIFILIAVTFHTSAIVCVSFYFLRRIKVNFNVLLFLVFTSIVLFIFFDHFINILCIIFPKYSWYKESILHGKGDYSLGAFIRILLSLLIFLWSIIISIKRKNKENYYNFFVISSYLYFLSQLFTLKMIVTNRFGYYFLPFVLVLVEKNINVINQKSSKLLVYMSICVFMISYFSYITIMWGNESYGVVPYMFFWE